MLAKILLRLCLGTRRLARSRESAEEHERGTTQTLHSSARIRSAHGWGGKQLLLLLMQRIFHEPANCFHAVMGSNQIGASMTLVWHPVLGPAWCSRFSNASLDVFAARKSKHEWKACTRCAWDSKIG